DSYAYRDTRPARYRYVLAPRGTCQETSRGRAGWNLWGHERSVGRPVAWPVNPPCDLLSLLPMAAPPLAAVPSSRRRRSGTDGALGMMGIVLGKGNHAARWRRRRAERPLDDPPQRHAIGGVRLAGTPPPHHRDELAALVEHPPAAVSLLDRYRQPQC